MIKKMGKFLVRIFVVFTTLYFLCSYILAWLGIEYFSDVYIIMAECIICVVMSSQGKYHCKYMKFTAYGLTAGDCVTRIDNEYEILSVDSAIILPLSLVMCSVLISFVLALRHFYQVQKIKRKKHEFYGRRTEEN